MDRVVLRGEEAQRFQVDAEIYRKRNRILVTMPALLVGNELGKTGQVATEDSPFRLKPLARRSGATLRGTRETGPERSS